jgi:hypothetical protein
VPAILGAIGTVAALAVGGYFGYQWYVSRSTSQAAAAGSPTNNAPAATEAALPAAPPSRPVWTLEVEAARIPEAPLAGSVAGAPFVPDVVRVDVVGTSRVLRLTQGAIMSPDREILVYLQNPPGESLAGKSLIISKDMKGAGVPMLTKRWKTDAQSAPKLKTFTTGYALRLELGQMDQGQLTGKIFVSLPDAEQTVAAGTFKAVMAPLPGVASPRARPAATPRAGSVPVQDRYGLGQ